MKRRLSVLLLVLSAFLCRASAGVDDQYIQVFNLIQEADATDASQPEQALSKYRDARAALLKFQKDNPSWSPSIVTFRLEYVSGKIDALSTKLHVPATPTPTPPSGATNTPPAQIATPAPATPPPPSKPAAPEDWDAQLNGLKEQVRQLQGEKSLLEAKLKEALSAQPAQTDPRELLRAQETIKAIQKENDLLKVTLDSQKAKSAPATDPKALEQSQRSLADANQQLTAQKELVTRLTLENQALQARAKQSSAPALAPPITVPISNPPESLKLKGVERERDALKKRLETAENALVARKTKGNSGRVQELENQLLAAQARLDILQARAVPYTPDELALLNQPATKLPETPAKPVDHPNAELTPEVGRLVAEARRFFQAGQLGQAENAYTKALRQDPANVTLLGDLASIQLEAGHLEDSQATVGKALALSPANAYALSVLGRLRLRQARYDEAVDNLSRAAKLEPANAEIQNFLGLALSEKGLRGPAEAALRKAIELDPNYASAHNNLAVVYVTGKPPAVELARWHYQRALAVGGPHNPQLEKLLEAGK